MGKGARLPKRTREIAESEHILSSSALESKQDEDLFMIDVKGDEQVYKKRRRELNTGVSSNGTDLKQKLKIASKQEEKKIQQLAKKKTTKAPTTKKNEKDTTKQQQPFDLWDDEPINTKKIVIQASSKKQAGIAPVVIQTNVLQPKVVTKSKKNNKDEKNKYTEQNIKKKQTAVDVAHPGQSYKPDEEQHKEAVAQAVQIELKRDEIVKYKNTPISNGMSKETLDVLITNSDDDDDDESDNEKDDTGMSNNNNNTILKKKKEKMTRAQRNTQKRHKHQMFLHAQNKKSRKYLKQFNIIHQISKDIDKHTSKLNERRERLEQIKKDKEKHLNSGTNVWRKVDPLKVASFPVGLSDEVKKESASLRSIIPKGSLLVDRAYSMSDRNMLNLNKKGNFS